MQPVFWEYVLPLVPLLTMRDRESGIMSDKITTRINYILLFVFSIHALVYMFNPEKFLFIENFSPINLCLSITKMAGINIQLHDAAYLFYMIVFLFVFINSSIFSISHKKECILNVDNKFTLVTKRIHLNLVSACVVFFMIFPVIVFFNVKYIIFNFGNIFDRLNIIAIIFFIGSSVKIVFDTLIMSLIVLFTMKRKKNVRYKNPSI